MKEAARCPLSELQWWQSGKGANEEPTVKVARYAFTVVDTDEGAAEKLSGMGFGQVNVATDTSVDLKFRADLEFRSVDAATEEPTVKLSHYALTVVDTDGGAAKSPLSL